MTTLLALVGWVIALGLTALALPFIVEVTLGLAPRRARPAPAEPCPPTVLLIPAHEEGAHIEAVLRGVLALLPPAVRVLVVADNCTDDTAAAARRAGADVIERHDPEHRGKGFALAFGRDHLRADPPAVVSVIDADCTPNPGSIDRLAARALRSDAAIQAINLLRPKRNAPPMVQISSFAFAVKNLVRQRGLRRLGAAAMLGGTGMAVPWRLFRDAPLATASIVEDLAFGLDLVRAGSPPQFEEHATVWTDPADKAATLGQRARWENGFIGVAGARALPMALEGLRTRRPTVLWAGLNLLTPPLALLVMLQLAGIILLSVLTLLGMPLAPLLLSIAVLLVIGLLVGLAWALVGRPWLQGRTLLKLPLYLAWKLPLYLRLLRGKAEMRWVRTDRSRWD